MEDKQLKFEYPDEEENINDEDVITEYDITSAPNDFNIKTLFDFIDSGNVKIPGFQRNYVWDIKRASKLIESIILGLPIPQIFFYQEEKNNFIVIDGQQRLMTIYFFIKKRFPIKDKIEEIRHFFDGDGKAIPIEYIENDEYFIDFNLNLPEQLPKNKNPFNKENYESLDDDTIGSFKLRTIRSIIIKDNLKDNDKSAIYEIFNRLNSGGINLTPQEIRFSLYHSEFFVMLNRINKNENWRKITPENKSDIHMKDIQLLLRVFAVLIDFDNYKVSMPKFLNQFSKKAQKFNNTKIEKLENIFVNFAEEYSKINKEMFYVGSNRFSITLFESIFNFACKDAYFNDIGINRTTENKINKLKNDSDFKSAYLNNTASIKSINTRLNKAIEIL